MTLSSSLKRRISVCLKLLRAILKIKNMERKIILLNWPMLYILENGKEAYIGESNHVKTRMNQHHMSVEKSIFEQSTFYLFETVQSVGNF